MWCGGPCGEAKAKGERKIGIQDFCKALALVAQDKGCGYDDLVSRIAYSEGPASSGTKEGWRKLQTVLKAPGCSA